MGSMEKPEEFCRDEYMDYLVYTELSKREKNGNRKAILEKLASAEYKHYNFWSEMANGYKPRISSLLIKLILMLRILLGLTFTLKMLERHEAEVINGYKNYLKRVEGEIKERLEEIIKEEEEHEKFFISQIDEGVVRYMSFIVLGLADAIVEITGVHAGFLGVTNSTLIAGIAGLVVGFAAAISMASAAYLQAKHDIARSPLVSAAVTGVSYIAAVAVLALPYFITHDMLYAFSGSVIMAVLLTASFTFYGAVISDKSFKREFIESVALILGTAGATFAFGEFLGGLFGVRQAISIL